MRCSRCTKRTAGWLTIREQALSSRSPPGRQARSPEPESGQAAAWAAGARWCGAALPLRDLDSPALPCLPAGTASPRRQV